MSRCTERSNMTHTQRWRKRERERTVRVLGPGELHLELLLKGEGLRGSGLKESRVLHPLMVLWYVCLHVRYHYHLLSFQTHSLFLHFFFLLSNTPPHWLLSLSNSLSRTQIYLNANLHSVASSLLFCSPQNDCRFRTTRPF